ncbi:dihydroxyacetone kinase subunit L [Virgibacillus halodenitrificans]|uniref:dihydroxyacetone kinase subunit DhaL n=1 Tax=Virgibacillus halodenitrificans TaxID=1482 RepID=UPI00136BA02A|nr:dihydroxyacetone kinase subunit DhaL [Virgibacillus halodenitrificans]MYL45687.1 dihydroxyacetone kinase subunit L [Virgibacillus halodenitrificans]
MDHLQVNHVYQWMKLTNDKIQKNKENLTSLDQAIGDGDHGINMARGFQEVMNKLDTENYEHVADMLKHIAMTLMSKVGGAAGPLYGTAFLKMSTRLKEQDATYENFSQAITEAVNGVKQRGKAEIGEKTMVDVWSAVADQMSKENHFTSELIVNTAKEAMESTKEMMATKGRAAYLKERSVGHMDPGSVSSFYLFEALAEVIAEEG